jgi:hypothetical protein
MKYVRLKPGSFWYHGSAERYPTHVPPCSFFSKGKGLAARFIEQPGIPRILIAQSYITTRLVASPRLLDLTDEKTHAAYTSMTKTEGRSVWLPEGDYGERAWVFCNSGVDADGYRNTLGIMLIDPDKFLVYGRPVQFSVVQVRQWRELSKRWERAARGLEPPGK